MKLDRLAELGFTVLGEGEEARFVAELMTPLLNPLTRQFIDKVTFKVRGGRLVPTDPPAMVGLATQHVSSIERFSDFESQLRTEFDRAVIQMQHRSAELQALGVQPIVDPDTLELWSEITTASLKVRTAADRQGSFRVVEAWRSGKRLELPANMRFDLSEFRDGAALSSYLDTLVQEVAGEQEQATSTPPPPPPPPVLVKPMSLGDLAERFGARAVIPQKTAIEIVADLHIKDERYRFAASRITGRTFRGLLAGPRGKVWADRFELDDFPGVTALAARELSVSVSEVTLVGLEVAGPPNS